MSALFTLAGVLIVSSVVSLVLVTTDDDSTSHDRAGAAPATSASTSAPAPSSSAPVAAPSESTSPVARTSDVAKTGGAVARTGETPATRTPITYTVKRGDNLTVIAAWFKLRGYGDLYKANWKVIGADPNLIRPGQRITVSSAGMSVSK